MLLLLRNIKRFCQHANKTSLRNKQLRYPLDAQNIRTFLQNKSTHNPLVITIYNMNKILVKESKITNQYLQCLMQWKYVLKDLVDLANLSYVKSDKQNINFLLYCCIIFPLQTAHLQRQIILDLETRIRNSQVIQINTLKLVSQVSNVFLQQNIWALLIAHIFQRQFDNITKADSIYFFKLGKILFSLKNISTDVRDKYVKVLLNKIKQDCQIKKYNIEKIYMKQMIQIIQNLSIEEFQYFFSKILIIKDSKSKQQFMFYINFLKQILELSKISSFTKQFDQLHSRIGSQFKQLFHRSPEIKHFFTDYLCSYHRITSSSYN